MSCNTTDFMFPMCAEIYHPVVEQGAYGNVRKQWILDRNVVCSFTGGGSAMKEEVKPNVNITQETVISGRVKKDIRISSRESRNTVTNILVTNIVDSNKNPVYVETAGPRAGKSTIFEVASQEPFVGPFGGVEYYKVVLRRAENQAVDV